MRINQIESDISQVFSSHGNEYRDLRSGFSEVDEGEDDREEDDEQGAEKQGHNNSLSLKKFSFLCSSEKTARSFSVKRTAWDFWFSSVWFYLGLATKRTAAGGISPYFQETRSISIKAFLVYFNFPTSYQFLIYSENRSISVKVFLITLSSFQLWTPDAEFVLHSIIVYF